VIKQQTRLSTGMAVALTGTQHWGSHKNGMISIHLSEKMIIEKVLVNSCK